MEERFWPFPIARPEAEWNEFDRDFINFMRAADAKGYRQREGPGNCITVGNWEAGRSASLVFRGSRNGWEPFLGESLRSVRLGPSYGLPLGEHACVCVRPPFPGRRTSGLGVDAGPRAGSVAGRLRVRGWIPGRDRALALN